MDIQQVMMAIDRRTFLKVIGLSLASAGVSVATADYLFPTEEKSVDRTFGDAIKALHSKEVSCRVDASDPYSPAIVGFEGMATKCNEELLRLVGRFYKNNGRLSDAMPGLCVYLTLGTSLPVIVKTARRLRDEPDVGALLTAINSAVIREQNGQRRATPGDDDVLPPHHLDVFGEPIELRTGGDNCLVSSLVVESICIAADWLGLDRIECLERQGNGIFDGEFVLQSYVDRIGSVPPYSSHKEFVIDEDLSWLDSI